MPKDVKGLRFNVQFDEKPKEENLTYQVIVFDSNKKLLMQQPVLGHSFIIPTETNPISLRGTRIFLAPFDQSRNNNFDFESLSQGIGYEVNISTKISTTLPTSITIPIDIWRWWWFCKCKVKGHVYNLCEGVYQPVYKARVRICEVDPIIWYIQKLPDLEILKLRDDIIRNIKDWRLPNPPIPDPPPFVINRIRTPTTTSIIRDSISTSLNRPSIPQITGTSLLPVSISTSRVEIELPKEKIASFYSASAYLIKDYLISNIKFLYPFWCRLFPWFLRCDEVAVVETNQLGWFEADIKYFCFGDRPDLYFRVEYFINGNWTTVYNPGMRCHTRWDYQCNTEVNLYLNDPRIPCPIEQPNLGDKDIFVYSIGNNVSVTKVHQDGGLVGQTMTNTPFEEGSPFGGSIEPRVYFGNYFADAIDGGNNYFYKWSFRREGEAAWKTITGDTFRHYVQLTPDGPIFPPYKIGPNINSLYQILRFHLPASEGGNDLWVMDSRTDTASTKFNTMQLDLDNNDLIDPFTATDGVYELKMEVYKYVAGVPTRVNLTAEGMRILVPLSSLSSPFGDITILPETNPLILSKYEYREGGNLFGFTMKIFIDNNIPILSLSDVELSNADGTTGVAGACGFIEFKDRFSSLINFNFHASQENNFATFGFGISKGNGSTDSFGAGDRVGVAATPLIHNGTTTVATITGIPGNYQVSLNPDTLLGICDKAAFTQSVSIHPLVQDGYSRLYGNWGLSTDRKSVV